MPFTISLVFGKFNTRFELSKKIHFRKIDKFVAATADHGFEHEEAEASGFFYRNGWRHGEFLAMNGNFDKRRPVMLESFLQHRPDLLCRLILTQKALVIGRRVAWQAPRSEMDFLRHAG